MGEAMTEPKAEKKRFKQMQLPGTEASAAAPEAVEIPKVVDCETADSLDSLSIARSNLMMDRFSKDGCFCPVCDKYARVYRRGISMTTIRSLLKIYWLFEDRPELEWIKVGERGHIVTTGGDYGKMRWWHLVEHKEAKREDGSSNNGHWRITQTGKDFVRRLIRIPRYVWEYNGIPITDPVGATNPMVHIDDLSRGKNRFSYEQIMSWR
jgi:hypothetical protein